MACRKGVCWRSPAFPSFSRTEDDATNRARAALGLAGSGDGQETLRWGEPSGKATGAEGLGKWSVPLGRGHWAHGIPEPAGLGALSLAGMRAGSSPARLENSGGLSFHVGTGGLAPARSS